MIRVVVCAEYVPPSRRVSLASRPGSDSTLHYSSSLASMSRPATRNLAITMMAAIVAAVLFFLIMPPLARVVVVPDPARRDDGASVVRGAFHVHSDRSDGSGSFNEIAEAARRAGLDFVILTDHGDGTRPPRAPTYHRGVLCVDAVEISTDGGHYIALNLPVTPYPLGGEAHGVVEDVARLGGFGVVAHPASPKPTLRWRDWNLPVDGVEWLNGDSQWRDDGVGALALAAMGYWLRAPESVARLLDRPDAALAQWDAQTAVRPVVGIGGTDAHARLATGVREDGYEESLAVSFPGYEPLFRAFAVRVRLSRAWRGDAMTDAQALLSAIRVGRTFTAIDALAHPARFSYFAERGAQLVEMGGRVDTTSPVSLRARVAGPPEAEMVLVRNGLPVARARAELEHLIPAGAPAAAYRVEVHLPAAPGTPPVPWIVGNPIYVGDRVVAVTPPRAAPASVTALDGPDGWHAEQDADSVAEVDTVGTVVRLRFRLAEGPAPHAAAVYEVAAGTLMGYDWLNFDVVSSQPVRASVQLRVAGREDLRWRRSFYAGPETRSVRVQLTELTPVTPALAARPDLGLVESVMVVVDAVNTPPGTAGTVSMIAPRLTAD